MNQNHITDQATRHAQDATQARREKFHDWLESEGFARPQTPPQGRSYNSSHIDLLWNCWLSAQVSLMPDIVGALGSAFFQSDAMIHGVMLNKPKDPE
jgi:hypothetical protein